MWVAPTGKPPGASEIMARERILSTAPPVMGDRELICRAFTVPPHMLGPPPPMGTKHQRGVVLREHARYMGLDFDQWPAEAQDVELAEAERECR